MSYLLALMGYASLWAFSFIFSYLGFVVGGAGGGFVGLFLGVTLGGASMVWFLEKSVGR